MKEETKKEFNVDKLQDELNEIKEVANKKSISPNKKIVIAFTCIFLIFIVFIIGGKFIIETFDLHTKVEISEADSAAKHAEWLKQYTVVDIDENLINSNTGFIVYNNDYYIINTEVKLVDDSVIGNQIGTIEAVQKSDDGKGYLVKNGTANNCLEGVEIYECSKNADIIITKQMSDTLFEEKGDEAKYKRYAVAIREDSDTYKEFLDLSEEKALLEIDSPGIIIKDNANEVSFEGKDFADIKKDISKSQKEIMIDGSTIKTTYIKLNSYLAFQTLLSYNEETNECYTYQNSKESKNIGDTIVDAYTNGEADSLDEDMKNRLVLYYAQNDSEENGYAIIYDMLFFNNDKIKQVFAD